MTPVTTVSLVGSTGSIGTQAVEVIEARPGRFDVVALGANRSVEVLVDQAQRLRPQVVAVGDGATARDLAGRLPSGTEVVTGPEGFGAIAEVADVVLNAVVGFAGLPVTLAALRAGRRLALANKESIIAGAPVVQPARSTPGAEIVPVDSEHCALHQCLQAGSRSAVRRLLLTASGGPFRGRNRDELVGVRVDEALAHPTWAMGPKITVDSSTLMNKGLEVIEAHELFGVDYDAVDVVVHPQSVVHSMVEFTDGAAIAQLSLPDMRLPIGYALSYPDRLDHPFGADRLVAPRRPQLRSARPRPLPVSRPRHPGRAHRRLGPGLAERLQRGGGGGLPRRPDPVDGHRRGGGGHPRQLRRPDARRRAHLPWCPDP